MIALSLIYFAQFFRLRGIHTKEEARPAALLQAAKLPSTSFQIDSITKRLDREATTQRELREAVMTLAKVTENGGLHLEWLAYAKGTLEAKVAVEPKEAPKLRAWLKEQFPKGSVSETNASVAVKVAL